MDIFLETYKLPGRNNNYDWNQDESVIKNLTTKKSSRLTFQLVNSTKHLKN